jgi:phage gp36-like protein
MPIVYATLASMQERYRADDLLELSDWDGAGEVDQARVERAIATAGNMIDGYVGSKYSSWTAEPLLVDLACKIAFFELHRATAPEGVTKAKDAAIGTLKDIAAGRVKLDAGEVGKIPTRPGAIHIEGRRRFTRDELDGAM